MKERMEKAVGIINRIWGMGKRNETTYNCSIRGKTSDTFSKSKFVIGEYYIEFTECYRYTNKSN